MSPCNCYCIKCPAEIFIEIRVCLRLSRSPGPSGSHYHSSSRIAIPDRKDKTLSNNLQLPPAVQQKDSSLASFCLLWWWVLHQVIILHPVTLGGACGTPEWSSVRIKNARIWAGAGIQMSATGPQKPWGQFFCLCLDLVSSDSWQCFVKGSLKAGTKNWEKRKEHRHKTEKVTLKIQGIWIQTFNEKKHSKYLWS